MKLSGSILVCCSVVSLAATAAAAGDREAAQNVRRDARLATTTTKLRAEVSAPGSVARPASVRLAYPLRSKSSAGLPLVQPSSPVMAARSGLAPAARVMPVSRVTRFQNALTNGSAVHIGRTPALERGGTARLNRFVFRRSAPGRITVSGSPTVAGPEGRD